MCTQCPCAHATPREGSTSHIHEHFRLQRCDFRTGGDSGRTLGVARGIFQGTPCWFLCTQLHCGMRRTEKRLYGVRINIGLLLKLERKGDSYPYCTCPQLAALHLRMPGTCFPLSARTFLSVNPGLQKLLGRDSQRLFYSLPELMGELSLTNLIRIDEHGDIFKNAA